METLRPSLTIAITWGQGNPLVLVTSVVPGDTKPRTRTWTRDNLATIMVSEQVAKIIDEWLITTTIMEIMRATK